MYTADLLVSTLMMKLVSSVRDVETVWVVLFCASNPENRLSVYCPAVSLSTTALSVGGETGSTGTLPVK